MFRVSTLTSLLAGSILGVSCFVSVVAHADVISPEEDACRGKSAGASCTATSGDKKIAGACAAATCSRLDYGSWNRDASPSPPSKDYPCVTCQAGGGSVPADDVGCSVSSNLARTAAPFGLAAIPAVVVALVRRRRR